MEIAEKKRLYYQEHAGEIAEKQRLYYQEHAGEIAEKQRLYREEHAGEIAEKQRQEQNCAYCGDPIKKSDYPHYCSKNCYLSAFNKYRYATQLLS